MTLVNIATLKEKLSEYLHRVEEGEEIIITSHKRRIARVIPEHDGELLIRPSTKPAAAIRNMPGIKPRRPFSVDEDLAWDRQKR